MCAESALLKNATQTVEATKKYRKFDFFHEKEDYKRLKELN